MVKQFAYVRHHRIRKHMAKEELIDELDHYLKFDAAPMSEQEQDKNTQSNELSQGPRGSIIKSTSLVEGEC